MRGLGVAILSSSDYDLEFHIYASPTSPLAQIRFIFFRFGGFITHYLDALNAVGRNLSKLPHLEGVLLEAADMFEAEVLAARMVSPGHSVYCTTFRHAQKRAAAWKFGDPPPGPEGIPVSIMWYSSQHKYRRDRWYGSVNFLPCDRG